MFKFLIINDFNDINNAIIRHFSLDKGHFVAKSLQKLGHSVYFLTTKNDYEKDGIRYTFIDNINDSFIKLMDYVLIVREPLFIDIIKKIPAIKNIIAVPKQNRTTKIIVKSDSPMWFTNKSFGLTMSQIFGIVRIENGVKNSVKKWIIDHVDFICAQNDGFANIAIKSGIPINSLLVSGMGISHEPVNYDKLINPYDINHSYCVDNSMTLTVTKALWPLYYLEKPNERHLINNKKYIIVYTGRIKTDNGKILFNMKNIMDILGEKYELHIFPGSFIIPMPDDLTTNHSSKNSHSLELLRNVIFRDSKNVIIHYPYEHYDKYRYLCFANCGLDFSDIRPTNGKSFAEHAKILEYCEAGLPVVCEENIKNIFLVKNGKNAIVLPYMASDKEYAEAIQKIVTMPIDRVYCRNITVQNENWDKKTGELVDQLSIKNEKIIGKY